MEEMSMPSSKYVRLVAIVLVIALLGLMSVYLFKQETASHTLDPSASLVSVNPKKISPVLKEVEHRGSDFIAKEKEHSQQSRFENEEQLCKAFKLETLNRPDLFQFVEGLQDYIQGSDRAIQEWLDSITSNGTPRQRGAALTLLAVINERQIRREANRRVPNCDVINECSEQVRALVRRKVSPLVDSLVNFAVHGSDPKLYSFAHNICQSTSFAGEPVCGRIDAMQWLQRDPDNGAAATYALAEMQLPTSGMDTTAFDNALYRLSLAKRFDYYFDLGGELPTLPATLDDYQHRTVLDSYVYSYLAMAPLPPYRNVVAACADENLKNPNRRFTCSSIANQFLSDNASLIDRAIFLKLATNLDWNKTKLQEIADDVDAVKAYLWEQGKREALYFQDASGQSKACRLNLKQFAHARKYAAKGEFKQYLQEASEFDIPRDELIKIGRRMRERK
jgi:hypothetical protein